MASASHQQLIRMQAKTDLYALDNVLAWFEKLDHQFVEESTWLQAKIALAEAFTNAVRHAHRDQPPETPIDLEACLTSQQLQIRIWDYGLPFDLEAYLRQLPAQIASDREGGRGLKIIQGVADQISYTRVDGDRNCLLLIKTLTNSKTENFKN